MKWGERLAELMDQHGETPKTLAKKMEVTPGFISQQKQRMVLPGTKLIQRFAEGLGISTAELLKDVEDEYDVLRGPPRPQKTVRRPTG